MENVLTPLIPTADTLIWTYKNAGKEMSLGCRQFIALDMQQNSVLHIKMSKIICAL